MSEHTELVARLRSLANADVIGGLGWWNEFGADPNALLREAADVLERLSADTDDWEQIPDQSRRESSEMRDQEARRLLRKHDSGAMFLVRSAEGARHTWQDRKRGG